MFDFLTLSYCRFTEDAPKVMSPSSDRLLLASSSCDLDSLLMESRLVLPM